MPRISKEDTHHRVSLCIVRYIPAVWGIAYWHKGLPEPRFDKLKAPHFLFVQPPPPEPGQSKINLIMKGKDHFTKHEIATLRRLIRIRVELSQQSGTKNEQKKVRDRMRSIGFYGGDDWGIFDCQESDLDRLIDSGLIKVE